MNVVTNETTFVPSKVMLNVAMLKQTRADTSLCVLNLSVYARIADFTLDRVYRGTKFSNDVVIFHCTYHVYKVLHNC